MIHNNTILYSWQTSEFEYQEKKKNWFWILGLVALGIIIIAIAMANYLLAVLIGIAAVLMVNQSQRQPVELEIEISEQGINIHGSMHTFETIRAFWIKEKKDGQHILILLTSQPLTPLLSIPMDNDINPMELRDYLIEFIPEEELRQSYTEQIIEKIGF